MAPTTLQQQVHHLSDIELALLLSLATHEHPILTTPASNIDSLTRQLTSIASDTFRLTYAVINCTPLTTLDDFTSALLIPSASASHLRDEKHDTSSTQIAHCILAPNLNLAPRAVQLQTLELLRTRRIFTHTSVQTTPRRFLFIPILPADGPGRVSTALTPHLNDFFALAHWHDELDGYVNLDGGQEEQQQQQHEETSSANSVVRRRDGDSFSSSPASISDEDIHHLAHLSQQVEIDIDVLRYQMNIVSFLRVHRAVQDGVTPAATTHFSKLMRCLASMHSLDYVTPALVALAAKKTYLHRIRITTPENERSMQWGSDLEAVATLLNGVGPDEVIDDVLNTVTAPV
ncbi:hypothetical protein E4U21_006219 [Claviceps maximensis]|nr:hypothetical protein E4U21_006219 [Claviceps maximensis]